MGMVNLRSAVVLVGILISFPVCLTAFAQSADGWGLSVELRSNGEVTRSSVTFADEESCMRAKSSIDPLNSYLSGAAISSDCFEGVPHTRPKNYTEWVAIGFDWRGTPKISWRSFNQLNSCQSAVENGAATGTEQICIFRM